MRCTCGDPYHPTWYNGYCLHLFDLPAGPDDFFDPPDRETMRLQKFGKLLAGPNTDLGMPWM